MDNEKAIRHAELFLNGMGYIAQRDRAKDKPDFWVIEKDSRGNQIIFLCEVQIIETQDNNKQKTIASMISNACELFKGISELHALRNVLFVYNTISAVTIDEFNFIISGMKEREYIDACIWFDETKEDFKISYKRDSQEAIELREWLSKIKNELVF